MVLRYRSDERSGAQTVLIRDAVRVNGVPSDRQLLTVLELPKFYTFSYEVYVHGTTSNWGQIVRFNDTAGASQNYPRPIAHWLTRRGTRIHAKAATVRDSNRGPDTRSLPQGQWTQVRIDILPSDSADHVYRISLNGQMVHEQNTRESNIYGQMRVWLGGDTGGRYHRANVSVRNMVLRPV